MEGILWAEFLHVAATRCVVERVSGLAPVALRRLGGCGLLCAALAVLVALGVKLALVCLIVERVAGLALVAL